MRFRQSEVLPRSVDSGLGQGQRLENESVLARMSEEHAYPEHFSGMGAMRGELSVKSARESSLPCLIWSVGPGYVTVITPTSLTVGAQVHLPGRFSGKVTRCTASEAGFRSTIRVSSEGGVGSRSDPRFAVERLGLLSLVGSSALVREEIEIVDFSATGMGIRVLPALKPGSNVMIELETGVIFGEVRHCTPLLTGWHRVGISLEKKGSSFYFAQHFIWKLRAGLAKVGEK